MKAKCLLVFFSAIFLILIAGLTAFNGVGSASSAAEPSLIFRGGFSDDAEVVEFTPDGKRFLTCGYREGSIKTWDSRTGRPEKLLKGSLLEIEFIDISNDGKMVAAAGKQGVEVWDIASSGLVRKLGGKQATDISHLCFSPDGRMLATAGGDNKPEIWDVGSGEILCELKGKGLTGHSSDVRAISFGPSGKKAATAGEDDLVKLWEVPSGELIYTFQRHRQYVLDVDFSPDGKFLAASGAGGVVIRDIVNPTAAGFLKDPEEISFSSARYGDIDFIDERTIISGSNEGVVLWKLRSGLGSCERGPMPSKPKSKWVTEIIQCKSDQRLVKAGQVDNICLRPDGKVIVTTEGRGIDFWNAETGEYLCRLYSNGKDYIYLFKGKRKNQFEATEGVKKYIKWKLEGNEYDADKFWDKYHRPGLFEKIMRNL